MVPLLEGARLAEREAEHGDEDGRRERAGERFDQIAGTVGGEGVDEAAADRARAPARGSATDGGENSGVSGWRYFPCSGGSNASGRAVRGKMLVGIEKSWLENSSGCWNGGADVLGAGEDPVAAVGQ